jgi:GxxExxY protein
MLHEETTDRILAAFFQVHYDLGFGFAESVYPAAMTCALKDAGLEVEREVPIPVHFRGVRIASFRADIVVERRVIIEMKAMRQPGPKWEAQLLNYLRATELEVGLLLYFNPKATFKRLIYTNDRKFSG